MIVYIAGPMTGIKDYNRPAFLVAEKALRQKGHKVLNPALLPTDLPRTAYMPICLAMIQQADAFYLLDGWFDSVGARIEWQYAQYLKKHVSMAGVIGVLEHDLLANAPEEKP